MYMLEEENFKLYNFDSISTNEWFNCARYEEVFASPLSLVTITIIDYSILGAVIICSYIKHCNSFSMHKIPSQNSPVDQRVAKGGGGGWGPWLDWRWRWRRWVWWEGQLWPHLLTADQAPQLLCSPPLPSPPPSMPPSQPLLSSWHELAAGHPQSGTDAAREGLIVLLLLILTKMASVSMVINLALHSWMYWIIWECCWWG